MGKRVEFCIFSQKRCRQICNIKESKISWFYWFVQTQYTFQKVVLGEKVLDIPALNIFLFCNLKFYSTTEV